MSALEKLSQNDSFFEENNNNDKDAHTQIKETHTKELVIAICGPIGSPLHEIADSIKTTLEQKYGYDCRQIRLSKFIEEYLSKIDNSQPIPKNNKFKKTEALIGYGDALREKFGPSVLAELAIAKIRVDRQAKGMNEEKDRFVGRRICHIINSIKNQSELDLLREVYREVLYVFGGFSPISAREANLLKQGFTIQQAYDLMERDAHSGNNGQTVSDTFPQSDFFLRMDTNSAAGLSIKVERYLDLILGTKIVTPTREESAMYAAASAANSSACLSRQVGAAVTDSAGEVLAVGWNDVPKPSGGLYQTDREKDPLNIKDMRCHNIDGGKCFNDDEKSILAEALIESLGSEIISEEKKELAIAKLLKDKKIKGLIEFSRAVHAEMHAILNSMRSAGNRVQGGSIYVTTYPCHGCARHIIASGISNVYYIEPYKKSLAVKLHGDSITETESESDKVRLLPFEGVAPSRYLSIFQMRINSRKSEGKLIKIYAGNALPKLKKSLQSLPELEGVVVGKLVSRGLLEIQSSVAQGINDGTHTA